MNLEKQKPKEKFKIAKKKNHESPLQQLPNMIFYEHIFQMR